MQAVFKVLRSADLEIDTFFELCGIDLKSVSPGTARIITPKELIQNVLKLDEHNQAKLIRLGDRIEPLADPVGQQVLEELSIARRGNPYDNAISLLKDNEKQFRQAEEIRYVEYHRGHGRLWAGYYLPKPIPLDKDVDLSAFQARLREHFKQDKLVIRRQFRFRYDDEELPVNVLQFVIYREGIPRHFEVLDEEGTDVEVAVIHPAREYAITYEPDTGVIELFADRKAIRDQLIKAFCKEVLQWKEEPEQLCLRRVNLELFREPVDFGDALELKHGIQRITVKEIEMVIAPGGGVDIIRGTPRKYFERDAYNTLKDQGKLGVLKCPDNGIRSVTLSFQCEETGELPKETIHVRLKGPNSCSLRDHTARERFVNHDLLVRMGILEEPRDD